MGVQQRLEDDVQNPNLNQTDQNIHNSTVPNVPGIPRLRSGSPNINNPNNQNSFIEKNLQLLRHNHHLEDELAKCKLQLVQSQCQVQENEHMMASLEKELKNHKKSWLDRFKDGDK